MVYKKYKKINYLSHQVLWLIVQSFNFKFNQKKTTINLVSLATDHLHSLDELYSKRAEQLEFAQFICQQGLGGLFHLLFDEKTNFGLPVKKLFKETWFKYSAATLARMKLLHQYWPKSCEHPLLIKGVDLEEALYRELDLGLGARSCSDWDLLIPSPYYEKVASEWTSLFNEPLLPESARFQGEDVHELGFYIQHLLFELHRDPAPMHFTTLTGQDLWDRSTIIESSWGQIVRQPCPEDRLLLWLLNFAKSGGCSRLLDWLDLTLILGQFTFEQQKQIFHSPKQILWLKSDSFVNILEDVLHIFKTLPLFLLFSAKVRAKHETEALEQITKVERMDDSVLLPTSLTKQSQPLLIAIQKIKYCSPRLRSSYLHRGLERAYRQYLHGVKI